MRTHSAFTLLAILTPAIVVFSGMAMTPLLFIFAACIVLSTPRAMFRAPNSSYPNYRLLLSLLGLMFVVPLLTSPWSLTPEKSFSLAIRVALLCLAGAAAFMYAPNLPRPSKKTATYGAISFAIISLLILQELFLGGGLIEWAYKHAHIPYDRFMDKNVNRGLCALAVLIWPLMLALYLDRRQLLAWSVFILTSFAILLMHSLSAKVGLCAGVVAFFALREYPVTTARMIAVFLPLFLFSFPWLFMLLESTFFANPLVREHLPPSAIHRLGIWHVLMDQFMQKPWLGWGMDTTRAMPLSPEQFERIHLETPPLHPHSPSLQVLLEEGIIGFVLTIASVALLLREWTRMPLANSLHRATAGALIVAYFASGVSSFGIWQHWWIATFWIAAILWRWTKNIPVEAAIINVI